MRVQDEIDPQFRIATAARSARAYDDAAAHLRVHGMEEGVGVHPFERVAGPGLRLCVGCKWRDQVHAWLARITRTPKPWSSKNFGEVEWMTRGQIGQEMIDLPPRSAVGDAGRVMSKG